MLKSRPEGWTVAQLSKFCEPEKAKWLPSDKENIDRYVGLEHLRPETRRVRSWGYSDQVISTKTPFRHGDVLFGKLRPNLRKIAHADFDGVCSTDILALRPLSNCDQQYLYWLLATDDVLRASLESSAGNVMPRTSWKDLAATFAIVPPLPEQKKIAAILTSVDEVIEKTEAQIAKLQDLKKAMMQELLTKGIGHTDFKDSPVGRIPASWEVKKIGSLGDVVTGSTPSTLDPSNYVGEIPFVSPADISQAKYIESTSKTISQEAAARIRAIEQPSVLVVCIGSTIGKVAVMRSGNFATNQQINAIVCKAADLGFTYYLMLFWREKIRGLSGQQAVPLINKSEFSSILIPFPPIDEQRKIGDIISSTDNDLAALRENLEKLSHLKKALMQDLLTGRVRVKV